MNIIEEFRIQEKCEKIATVALRSGLGGDLRAIGGSSVILFETADATGEAANVIAHEHADHTSHLRSYELLTQTICKRSRAIGLRSPAICQQA